MGSTIEYQTAHQPVTDEQINAIKAHIKELLSEGVFFEFQDISGCTVYLGPQMIQNTIFEVHVTERDIPEASLTFGSRSSMI